MVVIIWIAFVEWSSTIHRTLTFTPAPQKFGNNCQTRARARNLESTIYICAILQLQFYNYNFTILQLQYYNYNITITILQLQYYNYNITITILQLQYYNYNITILQLQFTCVILQLQFTCVILQLQFTCVILPLQFASVILKVVLWGLNKFPWSTFSWGHFPRTGLTSCSDLQWLLTIAKSNINVF
jgi:hypothetical protein